MFAFAGFIGIYSYLIFFLGVFSHLTRDYIWFGSVIWLLAIVIFYKKKILAISGKVKEATIKSSIDFTIKQLLVLLIVVLAFVNLTGALGPELGFDALWYHLTLPKLYLLHHAVYHIPGGLLYYSDMPKLGEMLYVGALSFGSDIFAKLIHFSFGILIAVALYKFSRKFFNQTIALLVVVIFYSNLVVDWESITAYIDLIRTFFEFLSLWGILNWFESEKSTWLVVSGIMIGFAITTKLLAIGSFLILLGLIIAVSVIKKKSIKALLGIITIFTIYTFLIPVPWFIFSYIHTGSPVYPFFTKTYEVSASSPNPLYVIQDLWNLFTHAADPISPLYLIYLPLVFIFFRKMKKEIQLIVLYSSLSLVLWYFTPRTGGGRFILPYLPAFSFICGAIYSEILKKTGREWNYITRLLLFATLLVAIIAIGYRGMANKRYLPVIIGQETKQTFLANNLNFHYGDFYDIDSYFARHIKPTDTVLLYGFHNLYYMDFPFIDNTWVKNGDSFNYIATQNTTLPTRFRNWRLVYANDRTMVQLYRPPKGVCRKVCRY